jgi:hypothetical protein
MQVSLLEVYFCKEWPKRKEGNLPDVRVWLDPVHSMDPDPAAFV